LPNFSRGIFASIEDRDERLMRGIPEHHKNPMSIKWGCDDPSRRRRQFF